MAVGALRAFASLPPCRFAHPAVASRFADAKRRAFSGCAAALPGLRGGRAAKFQASFSLSVAYSGARRSIALSCDPIPSLYAGGKGCSPGPCATLRAAACAPKTLPPARCGMNGTHGDGTHRSKSLPQIERSRRYELRSNRTNGSRIFQSKWGSGIQGWRDGRWLGMGARDRVLIGRKRSLFN